MLVVHFKPTHTSICIHYHNADLNNSHLIIIMTGVYTLINHKSENRGEAPVESMCCELPDILCDCEMQHRI